MQFDFGREVCGDLSVAERREWLVTNGIGGYACGTLAGVLTRCYHGLLVAALKPPLARTLLLAKLDATADYDGHSYPLHANRWADARAGETVEPDGFRHLERFHLEGTTPVWTYACADALLQKRVWMEPGANTTYVRYELLRAARPLALTLRALVDSRDHHAVTRAGDWSATVDRVDGGLRVSAGREPVAFHLLCDRAQAVPAPEWVTGLYLAVEDYRGLLARTDLLQAGTFHATLQPGESVTVAASSEAAPNPDGAAAWARRHAYEQGLIDASPHAGSPRAVQQLVLAADQFVVRRALPGDPDGRSVIAGYPWFSDWGRDTMIALPGLTLSTGRPEVAARILRTFAHFVDRGMLPNRFPDAGEAPEYNTVDATLWYFEAVRAYHAHTGSDGDDGDDGLLQDLFPVLEEIVDWHRRGTRYQIHVDPADGLLYAGEPGVQLTWMDAKVGDWVVTPRIGKPVEINALWYNALRSMAGFARRLGRPDAPYAALADRVRTGFERFWNGAAGYCYDVVDGPDGDDPALRPNQLLAVSLQHSPLAAERQRAVVDACARRLLTPHGLRSLAPEHPAYTGRYGGDQRQRDAAYHQGTVWGWLIGPFVSAHLRAYRDPALARSYLEPLLRHLSGGAVGNLSEIFEGDAPFAPRGCFAQAWSVAEVLRAWQETAEAEKTKEMRIGGSG